MSSVSRAGPRGGKGAAKSGESVPTSVKPQKTDISKTDTPKASDAAPKVPFIFFYNLISKRYKPVYELSFFIMFNSRYLIFNFYNFASIFFI